MKPFSIVCKSCASRLKVSKASAVNQLLACPKCGTMIRVTPPKGWVPPEPIKNSASFESSSQVDIPSPSSSDPFGGDFDDIEQILAKPQKPGAASTQQAPKAVEDAPQQTAARKVKLKQKTPAQTPQETRAVAPVPPTPPTDTDFEEPMLPNDEWQSDETRKRKRFVSTLVFLLGGLLLIGGIATAVIFNLPKKIPVVAKNENPANEKGDNVDEKKIVNINNDQGQPQGVLNPDEVQPMVDDEDDLDDGPVARNFDPLIARQGKARNVGAPGGVQPLEFGVEGGNGARIPVDNGRPDNMPINNQPIAGIDAEAQNNIPPVGGGVPGNENDPSAQAPKAIGDRNANPAVPNPAGIPDRPQQGNDDPRFPKPNIPGGLSPLEVPPLPDVGPNLAMVPNPGGNQPAGANIEPEPPKKKTASLDRIDGKIGDLSGLLERNGTSLTELRDIADGFSVSIPAGIPKYAFKKPDEIKPNLEKLKLNVGGMLYDKAPLPQVCRDFATITGIPITIDAETLVHSGKNPNEPVTITIKATTVDTALNEILVPLGLVKKEDGIGLTVTVANSTDFVVKKIATPESSKLDDPAKQRFLAYVQGMIDPAIWVREQNPASVKLDGNQIIANCPPTQQAKAKRLIEKLGAALTLIEDGSDPAALSATETRSNEIVDKLQKKIQLYNSIQLPIGSYLNKFHKKTGISVIVDWPQLIAEGWNPQTKVPGNIDEPTVQAVIQQLAQSMNLTVRVINSETLLLTTTSIAENSVDIEVYPVAHLLKGKFNPESLKEIFETTLGTTLRNSRYVFDPTCQCFVVAAAQSKQRQVTALLERLGDL